MSVMSFPSCGARYRPGGTRMKPRSVGRSSVDETRVGEPTGGHGHDVEVGDGERCQRRPGEAHVVTVELGHEAPGAVAHRMLGEVLEAAADDVPARVAGNRVCP